MTQRCFCLDTTNGLQSNMERALRKLEVPQEEVDREL